MGIYDREYYRDDGDGWWARMGGRQATVGLLIATGAVALLQMLSAPPMDPLARDPLSKWGEFDQAKVQAGQVWRIVTPLVLTDLGAPYPLWRVAAALLILYTVGTAVESIHGTREFLAFYLTAGGLIYLGKFLVGLAGVDRVPLAVGCGGAVTAALVLYACHHPAEKWYFFYVVPVPVWALAAGAVGIDLIGAAKDGGYPRWTVGALIALGYYHQHVRLTALADWFPRRGTGRRSSPRLSVYRGPDADEPDDEPVPTTASRPRAAAVARPVDEHLEAKLDQVLEKVSRFGRDSLTPEETQILLRASEVYKRRRSER